MKKNHFNLIAVALLAALNALVSAFASPDSSAVDAKDAAALKRHTEMFEKSVALIKRYETLHKPRNWPYIGYGHRVLPGERYRRGVVLGEKEAEALLRKDLIKNIKFFEDQGEHAIMLGTLAYNIGIGNVKKSTVYSKIAAGDTAIRSNYLNHSMYRGKQHKGLRQRRVDEYEIFAEYGLVKS